MASAIRLGLEKIRADVESLRGAFNYWLGGRPLAVLQRNRENIVATCYIINAASLLDEGLETYIKTHHPTVPDMSLGQEIDYLDRQGVLQAANRLRDIKDARNKYAHEPDRYGDLAELRGILNTIETELAHLGVI